MNILIVEDQKNIISDLKSNLVKLGHNVVSVASTGVNAIKYTEDLNPDLILINVQLKGKMSGLEVAQQIEAHFKIPIIFIVVFIKNCLNKSLQLPENAIVLSLPIKQDHLEYCISRAFSELFQWG